MLILIVCNYTLVPLPTSSHGNSSILLYYNGIFPVSPPISSNHAMLFAHLQYVYVCVLAGHGMPSMFVPSQHWLVALETLLLFGSLSKRSLRRLSFLETFMNCVPAALPSHPALCLRLKDWPFQMRPTRKRLKGTAPITAPPPLFSSSYP